MELTLKEVFEAAKKVLSELISIDQPDFRLEQLEYNHEKKEWEVVVSYLMDNKNKGMSPIFNILPFERVYKRLKINDEKEVVGIYMFSEVK